MKLECAFFGSAARPIELKTSKAGKSWAQLSIGVENGDTREDGSTQLEWIKVSVFGSQAEALAGKVEKGTRLYCEGSLRVERWQTSDGEQRFTLSCAASKCERVGASAIGRNRKRETEPGTPSFAGGVYRQALRVLGRDDFNDQLPI
jgi:single-strand DNA-binding protein